MSLRGRPGSGAHPYAAAANGYQQFTPEPAAQQQQQGSGTGYTVPVPASVYTEHTAYQVSRACIATGARHPCASVPHCRDCAKVAFSAVAIPDKWASVAGSARALLLPWCAVQGWLDQTAVHSVTIVIH